MLKGEARRANARTNINGRIFADSLSEYQKLVSNSVKILPYNKNLLETR